MGVDLEKGKSSQNTASISKWGQSSLASVKGFLLSPLFQSSAQLVPGILGVSLFVFVGRMRFYDSCLVGTLFPEGYLLISQGSHLGSMLLASSVLVGAAAAGSVTGGVVVSLAQLAGDGGGYTALLCVLASLFLIPHAYTRMSGLSPLMWMYGLVGTLLCGIVCMTAQFDSSPSFLWPSVVGYYIADATISGAFMSLMSMTVLTSLAHDELAASLAKAIRGIGYTSSRHASHLFSGSASSEDLDLSPQSSLAPLTATAQHGTMGTKVSSTGSGLALLPAVTHSCPGLGSALEGSEQAGAGSEFLAGPQIGSKSEPSPVVVPDRKESAWLPMVDIELEEGHADNYASQQLSAPCASLQQPSQQQNELELKLALLPQDTQGEAQNADREETGGEEKCDKATTRDPVETDNIQFGVGLKEADDETYHFMLSIPMQVHKLQASSHVSPQHAAGESGALPPLASYRALLGRARALVMQASYEPTCMLPRPFDAEQWSRVISQTDALLTALTSLELVLEQQGATLSKAAVCELFATDLMSPFRRAYATVAAACAHLSARVAALAGTQEIKATSFQWNTMREEIREVVVLGTESYWQRIHERGRKGQVRILAAEQIRMFMFTWNITDAIIDAVEDLDASISALAGVTVPAAAHTRRSGTLLFDRAWLNRNLGWLVRLLGDALALPFFLALRVLFTRDLPALLQPGGVIATLRHRRFQAGAKYWALTSIILLLILGLSANPDTPAVKTWHPTFGYIATAIAATDRVEFTVSRLLSWVVGASVGGTLGYLAMLSTALATSPYGLAAIICTFTGIVGFLNASQFRFAIIFTLLTFNGVIMCQYNGETAGTLGFYLARVLAVACGSVLAAVICNLILPWFTSSWALETMGGAYVTANSLLVELYEQFFADAEAEARPLQESKQQEASPRDNVSLVVQASLPSGRVHTMESAREPSGFLLRQLPDNPLHTLVGGPLAGVEVSLQRDVVFWSRGVLHTPPIVPKLLQMMYGLSDRLSALRLSLVPPRKSCRRHSGWDYHVMLLPTSAQMRAMLACLERLAATVAGMMAGDRKCDTKMVILELEELGRLRVAVRSASLAQRRAFLRYVASEEYIPNPDNFDDIVRTYSFFFALAKVLDQATQIGVLASGYEVEEEALSRTSSWLK